MAKVNVYISYNGNCEEAFNHYKSVFGGEFSYLGRFRDMPSPEGITEDELDKIMHISLPISNETVLFGSDVPRSYAEKMVFGNNFSVSVSCSSEEEANNLFNNLSEGGFITMPLEKTFWNAYFGMFVDKFGINWMINYDYPQE